MPEPPQHIAIVSCTRRHGFELGPNLLSLSTHAPHAHVHLFTDAAGRSAISACVPHLRSLLGSLEVHDVEDLGGPMVDYNASLGVKARLQGKFACASAKLMLQGAPPLRHVPYVLALDVDTVSNENLHTLWRWTAQMEAAGTLWGLVRERGGQERPEAGDAEAMAAAAEPAELKDEQSRPKTGESEDYFNTGVLLIAAARLRERNITHPLQLLADLVGTRTSAGTAVGTAAGSAGGMPRRYKEFGLGEQNLLNTWLRAHALAVTPLPCRWNRRIDSACYDGSGAGIRHANRMLAAPRAEVDIELRLRRLLRDADAHDAATVATAAIGDENGSNRGSAHGVNMGVDSSSRGSRHALRPESACTNATLRSEWRGNVSAREECVRLVAQRWARQDVKPWHEKYRLLACAAAGGASHSVAVAVARAGTGR